MAKKEGFSYAGHVSAGKELQRMRKAADRFSAKVAADNELDSMAASCARKLANAVKTLQFELEDQLYTFHEEKADTGIYEIKFNEFQGEVK